MTIPSYTTSSGNGISFTQNLTTVTISVDDTVTVQGNEFNGASQLVQLDENKSLPDIDGSNLTGIGTSTTSNMPEISSMTTSSITYGSGFCWDNTLTKKITLSSSMTKTIDSFTEGSENGSLDTGTVANSTWYYTFLISKENGTSDILTSLSSSSPTMPSGFTYKRRIGCLYVDGSGNLLQTKQTGNTFFYETLINDVDVSNLGTSYIEYTLTIPAIECFPLFSALGFKNATNTSLIILPYEYGAETTPTNVIFTTNASSVTSGSVAQQLSISTTQSKVRIASSVSSTILRVNTHGFKDRRKS